MKGELDVDPRGLMFEAYRMDLTPEECRVIFLDWLLGRPDGTGGDEVATLLAHYGTDNPGHPMTSVLRQGLEPSRPRGRRRRPS